MGRWSDRHCRRGVRLTNWSEPLDFPSNPIYLPDMKQIRFDSNGIYASAARLSSIALECLEQERRERACLRAARAEGIQWTDWHISDRH